MCQKCASFSHAESRWGGNKYSWTTVVELKSCSIFRFIPSDVFICQGKYMPYAETNYDIENRITGCQDSIQAVVKLVRAGVSK